MKPTTRERKRKEIKRQRDRQNERKRLTKINKPEREGRNTTNRHTDKQTENILYYKMLRERERRRKKERKIDRKKDRQT